MFKWHFQNTVRRIITRENEELYSEHLGNDELPGYSSALQLQPLNILEQSLRPNQHGGNCAMI